MKILVIDDERPALRRLTESVQNVAPDAEIYPFSDTDEYFAHEPKTGFDAAFVDIELGEMSGIELALEIKKHSPLCNIIFVTSYSKYGAEAFSARPSGFIVKPFTEDELRNELDNLRYPLSESKKQEKKIRVS